MVTLEKFCLGVKILVWCIDPNNIQNKTTEKYPHLKSLLENWTPPYRHPNGMYKNDTKPTLVWHA